MPVTVSYPGVYLEEVPSGNRTVTGVATAITAFVGTAPRGPLEPVEVHSFAEYERRFGALTRDCGMAYAVRDYFRNGGTTALVVRMAPGAAASKAALGNVTFEAANPGNWGDSIELSVPQSNEGDESEREDIAAQLGVKLGQLLTLVVREGSADSPRILEEHRNVTLVDSPRRLDAVLRNSSELVRVTLPAEPQQPTPGATVTLKEGEDAETATGDAYEGAFGKLEKVDLFTLLVLPPKTPTGQVPDSVWASALALCRERRAFLLVDPPPDVTATAAFAEWVRGLGLVADGSYGAVYYPRLRCPDPLRQGAVGEFAPGGAIAGVFARTDTARGVWKAPAGIEAGIAGARGLATIVADADSGALNPKGINCLRTFRDAGTVVWGARTLRGSDSLSDDYKYVPVRRLALYIEESLLRGTQWVVFEPNDAPLWGQIRASVGSFMQDLFRKGAFAGASPREAYFVKCDSDTTTAADVAKGKVNVHVGFAPLKPAEFVVVSIQQKFSNS